MAEHKKVNADIDVDIAVVPRRSFSRCSKTDNTHASHVSLFLFCFFPVVVFFRPNKKLTTKRRAQNNNSSKKYKHFPEEQLNLT